MEADGRDFSLSTVIVSIISYVCGCYLYCVCHCFQKDGKCFSFIVSIISNFSIVSNINVISYYESRVKSRLYFCLLVCLLFCVVCVCELVMVVVCGLHI